MSLILRAKALAKDILPPILLRALHSHRGERESAIDVFYRDLITPHGLCFDVGANVGNRVSAFRRLGLRVVAIEPQPSCFLMLRSSFGKDGAVTLLNVALGSTPGQASMTLSNSHVLSSMSSEFIEATKRSGRFGGASWEKTIPVEVVTLDTLIAQYGVPDFIKIDVEGFELEVVRGLTRSVRLISMEWVPELTDNMLACIAHLASLGPIRCNLSWGESMRMARKEWIGADALKLLLDQFRGETTLFGDVYIRSDVSI